MATMADRIREFRGVMLQDEGWARYLTPPPIRDRPLPQRNELAADLPTDFQLRILRLFGPLEEISVREVGYRLGMAPDRIQTDVSRLVRVGWLYAALVPGHAVAKLYGITDGGEAVKRGPSKTEARGRVLQTIHMTDSPHKPHAEPAKPVDIRHADWDDWVHTGARWVKQAEFEAMSGPCEITTQAHSAPSQPRKTNGGHSRRQSDYTTDSRRAEIVRLYQDGYSQLYIRQKLRLGCRRLARILHAEGLSIRPSGEQAKISTLRGETQCHQAPRQSCTT